MYIYIYKTIYIIRTYVIYTLYSVIYEISYVPYVITYVIYVICTSTVK